MTKTAITVDPEPKWEILTLPTLKKASKEVLEITLKKRTLKTAYVEALETLKSSDRELKFTCQECGSLIDDKMKRCWACGLVFTEAGAEEETEVVDAELKVRAKRLGLDVSALSREEAISRIEEAETQARASKADADLLRLESKKLNVKMTENLPDGWRKKKSKQYTSYFDSGGTRRIAVWDRGMKVDFSVDDKFLDGFPGVEFFDAEERKKRHYGRSNYSYSGDTFKTAFDLTKRVFGKYA